MIATSQQKKFQDFEAINYFLDYFLLTFTAYSNALRKVKIQQKIRYFHFTRKSCNILSDIEALQVSNIFTGILRNLEYIFL